MIMEKDDKPILWQYIRKTVLVLLSVTLVISLLYCYRLIVFYLEGGSFGAGDLMCMLAFTHTEKEFTYALFFVGIYFIAVNFASPAKRRVTSAVLFSMFFLWLVYRSLNLVAVYASGTHINKLLLDHIEGSVLGMFIDIKMLIILIVSLAIPFVSGRVLRPLDYSGYSKRLRVAALLIMALTFWSFMKVIKPRNGDITGSAQRADMLRTHPMAVIAPERFLGKSFEAEAHAAMQYDFTDGIDEGLKSKLRSFGLGFGMVNASYPLLRDRVYTSPFPYAEPGPGQSTPNIIILVMESLSSNLIGYNNRIPQKLTPNLDRIAGQFTPVEPAYNSSMPTINGLISILCSHLPVSDHFEYKKKAGASDFDMLCLPEVLGDRGYSTYFVMAGNPYFTNKKTLFESNGIQSLVGVLEITDALGQEALGDWGVSDHQLYRYVGGRLQRSEFKEPFFLIVENVDMHPLLKLKADTLRYPGSNGVVQDLAYSTDIALGDLWAKFQDSPYADDTIVVITADHAMHPGREYQVALEDGDFGNSSGKYFDEIPLLIYDPVHHLPERIDEIASSIDIAPSLLHMLGINVPNSFEGLSIFDREGRVSHQNLLGSNPNYYFYLQDGKPNFEFNYNVKCDAMAEGSPEGPLDLCDYYRWFSYKTWLVNNDRIWDDSFMSGLNHK